MTLEQEDEDRRLLTGSVAGMTKPCSNPLKRWFLKQTGPVL